MEYKDILKALVLKTEQSDVDNPDGELRILVAASLEVLKIVAAQSQAPRFDFDNELDKAYLVKAVHQVYPSALTVEDKEIVELWNQVVEQS